MSIQLGNLMENRMATLIITTPEEEGTGMGRRLKDEEPKRKRPRESRESQRTSTVRDWSHWKGTCRRKKHFKTEAEAEDAAKRANDRLSLMFSPLAVYKCPRHPGWHMGHMHRGQYESQKKRNDTER
jgi:hypothetical protein